LEQITNFLVCEVLCIGLFGLYLVAVGISVTNLGNAYPHNMSLKGTVKTWHSYVNGINRLVLSNFELPAVYFVLARI
jgi:hypothetical protein